MDITGGGDEDGDGGGEGGFGGELEDGGGGDTIDVDAYREFAGDMGLDANSKDSS